MYSFQKHNPRASQKEEFCTPNANKRKKMTKKERARNLLTRAKKWGDPIHFIGRKLTILVKFISPVTNELMNGSSEEKVLWSKGRCHCHKARMINSYWMNWNIHMNLCPQTASPPHLTGLNKQFFLLEQVQLKFTVIRNLMFSSSWIYHFKFLACIHDFKES